MRCVLVTGSSRGIGLGIARAFAAQGDRVVLNGRQDKDRLRQSVEEIRRDYPEADVMGICADLADCHAVEKLFQSIEAEFGMVEVLVNNAGSAYFGLFGAMTPQDIRVVLMDNLYTVLNASHRAVPNMVRAKAGCIVNVTSVWGQAGASCEAVYSAAKAGVIGFTKSLAKELAPSGIRVNAIACGAFETRMNDRLQPQEKIDFMENIPMGRFGHPHEAGQLAVFLASEECTGYLTGQVVGLDGGLV